MAGIASITWLLSVLGWPKHRQSQALCSAWERTTYSHHSFFSKRSLALCTSFSAGAAPVSEPKDSYRTQSGKTTQSMLKNVRYNHLSTH